MTNDPVLPIDKHPFAKQRKSMFLVYKHFFNEIRTPLWDSVSLQWQPRPFSSWEISILEQFTVILEYRELGQTRKFCTRLFFVVSYIDSKGKREKMTVLFCDFKHMIIE